MAQNKTKLDIYLDQWVQDLPDSGLGGGGRAQDGYPAEELDSALGKNAVREDYPEEEGLGEKLGKGGQRKARIRSRECGTWILGALGRREKQWNERYWTKVMGF